MNDVRFEKQDGNLGIKPDSKDHYAALVVYESTKPTGFATEDIKVVNSIETAESLGITSTATSDVIKALHYHLERFFAIYKRAGITPQLWVMVADKPASTYDFEELTELQNFAEGGIRKFGVYTVVPYSNTLVNTMQTVLSTLETNHRPCSAIVGFDWAGQDWSAAPNLRTLFNPKIHVTIGQDGGNAGKELAITINKSLTDLGSILGWSTIKKVCENIGWVEKFNVAFDGEFDEPALADGSLVKDNLDILDSLNTKGYIFLKKHVDYSGTYFNDSHAAVLKTSDYAYMENNDVIDKAIRGIRLALLPSLNADLEFDDAGQLDPVVIADFEGKAVAVLEQMKRDGEISTVRDDSVYIAPDQDIITEEELVVNVKIYIKGIARNILVKIGLAK